MLRLIVFLGCCNTTEKCGTAYAILLVSQQYLDISSKPAWAAPWEDQTSCVRRNSCTSHTWGFSLCFLSFPAPARSLDLSLPLSPPSPANPLVTAPLPRWGTWKRGGPLWTPLLQRAPWGPRLGFPSLAVRGHSFSARHQGLKALCRLPCLETPSSAPERRKRG